MPLLPVLLLLVGGLARAAEGPDLRLDRLIAASRLDRDGLRSLAPSDPAVVYQLLDPASRAALNMVPALPPAEIRRVRDGQTVIRTSGEWSEAERTAIRSFADVLGANVRKVDQVRATVVVGALVRVELAGRRATTGVGIAWQSAWKRAELAAALRAELGVRLPREQASLVDPSFEDAHALDLVWQVTPIPRARAFLPEAGTCLVVAGSPWSAACPIAVMLTRAWGPAGSGADLDDAARAALHETPRIGRIDAAWKGTPNEVAAATSFAAWLQKTQGVAGVRAAWLAAPLGGYSAVGKDADALDAA